jgi:aspartate carbamoyltransferase catalytic subunit
MPDSTGTPTQVRHFIEEPDLSADEFRALIAAAIELKASWNRKEVRNTLQNRTLAMIFEKASTRTRCSFEAGMNQLGGHAINLSPSDSQLGRGEPITDTSKVLSEMVDVAMLCSLVRSTIESICVRVTTGMSAPIMMPQPPTLAIGLECTLRLSSGMSIMPRRGASLTIIGITARLIMVAAAIRKR